MKWLPLEAVASLVLVVSLVCAVSTAHASQYLAGPRMAREVAPPSRRRREMCSAFSTVSELQAVVRFGDPVQRF